MDILYITHPTFSLHEMGSYHPESPARLDAIEGELLASGLINHLDQAQARDATDEDLLRVHTPSHLALLARHAPAQGHYPIDPDTIMNAHTLAAARLAAGAGLVGVDAVMRGDHRVAFCAVRPPGHHATPDRAMGFCFYNNIAVAAAYALDVHGLERVAIIDFDVHHGNGTEDAFAHDNRILMCSFYQYPLYPGTRHDPPADNMLNLAVPPGTSGAELRDLVHDVWLPRLRQYSPEMFFISAGFDAHRKEQLGQLAMVEEDYAWITSQLVSVADTTAQGRIVSMLEGGYELSALGRSVAAHIKALSKL